MTDERMQRYSDIIIEHSQFPRHHGSIENPTHHGTGENPFCGDRVSLKFTVDEAGKIENIAIESVGCAISTASASLLASNLKGLGLANAEDLFKQVRDLITEVVDEDTKQQQEEELGELAALAFAGRYPSRVKCATLAWHVLNHALSEDDSVATTE
jgi:nitrogen fixation NifU-like protein